MAFEFVSQLREDWLRCAVRVELLMAEHGLSREEVLSAAARDPVHGFTFKLCGLETHAIFNLYGFQPNDQAIPMTVRVQAPVIEYET